MNSWPYQIPSRPDGRLFPEYLASSFDNQEVLECLEFQEEDNDKEANCFLVKANQNLENCVEMLYNNDVSTCI